MDVHRSRRPDAPAMERVHPETAVPGILRSLAPEISPNIGHCRAHAAPTGKSRSRPDVAESGGSVAIAKRQDPLSHERTLLPPYRTAA